MSLCGVSLCWVSLCWMSLCWVSWWSHSIMIALKYLVDKGDNEQHWWPIVMVALIYITTIIISYSITYIQGGGGVDPAREGMQIQTGNSIIDAEWKISFKNETKWYKICPWLKGWGQKNSSNITVKFLLKVLTKVGLNFIQFAWMKVTEGKQRVTLCSKKTFFLFQPSKLK
jgi:hypothetical protein